MNFRVQIMADDPDNPGERIAAYDASFSFTEFPCTWSDPGMGQDVIDLIANGNPSVNVALNGPPVRHGS